MPVEENSARADARAARTARPDARTRVPDDWFVGFHRGLAARFWRAAGATMADEDARLIGELLDAAPGAKVLDVPCGDGRIALRLAAAGHEVIGIDLAAGELDHARREAAKAATPASFLVGDLRALPDVGLVEAVVSWGNSFGYLVPADSARSLAAMQSALRPGGRLVLETATVAESLLVGGVKPTASWEFGGVRMTATNRYRPHESRLESDYVFEDAHGLVERARAAHHVHTSGELVRMLADAGFRDVALLGADAGGAYELGSARLIVVATRDGRRPGGDVLSRRGTLGDTGRRQPREERSMDKDRLKSIPVFAELDDDARDAIAKLAAEVSVPEGKELVREGDFSYELIAIEEGTARVHHGDETLAELGPGDIVGETGVLEGTQRNASVTATSPMRLVTLTTWDVRRLGKQAPGAIERLRELAAARRG